MKPRTKEQLNNYLDRELHLNKFLFDFTINELNLSYVNEELSITYLTDIQKYLMNEEIDNQIKKIIGIVIKS